MKIITALATFFFLVGCESVKNKSATIVNSSRDTTSNSGDELTFQEIDTSTLAGKRAFILAQFNAETPLRVADYDTLIDLTYDAKADYVIGYYGMAGSGIKNRIEVFLFNEKAKAYIYDTLLSDLVNPTFYLDKRKITDFYIGNGGGGGSRLEWINNKWTPTKTFTVDKQDSDAIWIETYPLQNKSITSTRPFQMVPPNDILETEVEE